jgi:hypothetical protein
VPVPTRPHRAALFVSWANAVLAGAASPDLAAERVSAGDPPHVVDGLDGGDAQSLPVVLAWLGGRRDGRPGDARTVRLVLPVAGDPAGLPGPGAFTTAALVAGEAVVLSAHDVGLVPAAGTQAVRWQAYGLPPAGDLPGMALPQLAEAEQALAAALREATQLLDRLDLSRPDPDAEPPLAALRAGRLAGPGLPPGYPDRAAALLGRARLLRTAVQLAASTDGAAATSAEADARMAALRPLDQAARYAEMAAYNVPAEPWARAWP